METEENKKRKKERKNKEKIKAFIGFLKRDKQRQFSFFLTLIIFALLPADNYYTRLEISPQRPVVRQIEAEEWPLSLYPINVTGRSAPELSAASVLAVDVSSKTIIFAKNPDQPLFPASITKIMTALVSLDYYRLDQILTVEEVRRIGQTMELEEGEKITVEDLLYGLLVQSGNDAAYALAVNYPGGTEAFVAAMNQKAEELNLQATNFVNPAGIDGYEHLTTAHDLAVLAAEAMKNETFAKMVGTVEIEVSDVSGQIKHSLENINQLLGRTPGLKGVKTGWTVNAGECLAAYVERNDQRIITVILGSEDRFGETEKLVDWVFKNYQWEAVH